MLGTIFSPSSPGSTFGREDVHAGDQAVGGAEVDAYDAFGFFGAVEFNLEHGLSKGAAKGPLYKIVVKASA